MPEKIIGIKKAKKENEGKLGEPDSGPSPPIGTSFGEPVWVMDIPDLTEPATQESTVCASQAEHLLNGDMWKNCNKCRALIHRLSIELSQTVHVANGHFSTWTAAEDEFEIIG